MRNDDKVRPKGYEEQTGIPCCANCIFGGYLGDVDKVERMVPCELLGEPSDGSYYEIAVEPLGLCDAYKPNV